MAHKIKGYCNCRMCKIERGETNIKSPRLEDGRSVRRYYCKECDKEIHWHAALYGTGKCGSCRQRGKKLTEEHKAKIGANNVVGQFKKGHKTNVGKPTWNKGKTYQISEEARRRNKGASHYFPKGELHPNWQGGRATLQKIIRSTEAFNRWRKSVYAQNGFRCVVCGSNKNIEAHHIKSFRLILDIYNIVTLDNAYMCYELWDIGNGETRCKECHNLTRVGLRGN